MHFLPANISLPDFSVTDAERWAVIACDQFTSEPAYWDACRDLVGDAPSTLKMILPEAWLGTAGEAAGIERAARTMRAYRGTVLSEFAPCYVYVERVQSDGRCRAGLVGMIDLEDYDFAPGAVTPVRATEETVVARIPPRVRIRMNAVYELPHIMLLTDDPEDTLLSPYAGGRGLHRLYDTPLLLGGGHLTGWRVDAGEARRIDACLRGTGGEHPLVLAVGDGNHSLATAKTVYEHYKAEDPASALASPLRYALVEVVNLHSPALDFEPIYRIAVGCDPAALAEAFTRFLADGERTGAFGGGRVTLLAHGMERTETYERGCHPLPVGVVDAFLEAHPEVRVDYIHGEDALRRLAAAPDAVGFLFPGIRKEELFPVVERDGSLPRKTFSMGQARDKRYYMEARLLR